MENKELLHWGIKGMKWGLRRYQNKDGSLTAAGKKRYGDGDETDESSNSYKTARKSVKSMSDTDLDSAIERLRKEQTYKRLYDELNPQTVSKGKQFASAVMNKVVSPALMDAGKSVLKDYATDKASKALGLKKDEVDTVYKALKKEADTLNLKKQIDEAKTYFDNKKARAEDAALKKEAEQYKTKRDIAVAKDYLMKSESEAKARAEAAKQKSAADVKTHVETAKQKADYIRSQGGSPMEVSVGAGMSFVNDYLDINR